MFGAIVGDIIGSTYEWNNAKREDFELFPPGSRYTDDTVLTCATADAILQKVDYGEKYREYFNRHQIAGYGANFMRWAFRKEPKPYNSYGNGSAMRVSPVAYAFNDLEIVIEEAKNSAQVTHNHPEGIKGAQATAASIFLARKGLSKEEIKSFIVERFCYNLDFDLLSLNQTYKYDISCQGSVPQAIFCFLQSNNYEDAIRKAIFIGGDSDTIACITGSIAEAYYQGVPTWILDNVLPLLAQSIKGTMNVFYQKYNVPLTKRLSP